MPNRKYELVVVLDPLQTEEQQNALLGKIEGTLTKNNATIEKRDAWGKRRLAYEINNRREGFYSVITFDGDSTGTVLAEVDRTCRLEEGVLRHLCVQAVVGKSAGTPPSDAELAERFERRPPRRDGGGRGRMGPGGPPQHHSAAAAPAAAAPAADAAPAPTE